MLLPAKMTYFRSPITVHLVVILLLRLVLVRANVFKKLKAPSF